MTHVILLGDSIFDNARYVPGGPAVIEQLRSRLPAGGQATLLAVDGSVVASVPRQLARMPADASHLIVSIGGNDALGQSSLLEDASHRAPEGFALLAEVQEEFRRDYQAMLGQLLAAGKPTVPCTIYDAIPGLRPAGVTGLSVFNDVILREAFRAGLPVLDLRLVCDEPADYSTVSPIEPSRQGGFKIARAIARVLADHDFGQGRSVVYGS